MQKVFVLEKFKNLMFCLDLTDKNWFMGTFKYYISELERWRVKHKLLLHLRWTFNGDADRIMAIPKRCQELSRIT